MPPATLLTCLDVRKDDSVISVVENDLADANFVLTHLARQSLQSSQKICLVAVHNGLSHYQNVLKRLGCDLLGRVKEGEAEVVEFLDGGDVLTDVTDVTERLFAEIEVRLKKLTGNRRLVIDDLSHFFDLGVELRDVIGFVNRCVNLTAEEGVSLVVNTHVSTVFDGIVANSLGYVADVVLDVAGLKTGRSHNVTGVIKVSRRTENKVISNEYHYKATDKGIMAFFPGESLNFLYR